MKKTLLLLGAIALVTFTGCSSDDDNNNNNNDNPGSGALVKKIVFDYVDDDYSDEVTYTYNGNKLVKGVYTDGSEDRFFYTGDRITKIEYLYDGEVEVRELFTYNESGMLTEYRLLELDWGFEEKSTYEVTGENTVLETYYSGDIDSPSQDWTAVLTMSNGEVIQKVQTGWDGTTTYTYTYDTKNSPFKNVTGYGALAYAAAGDFELDGFARNIVSIVDNTHSNNYVTNTYTYNSNNYPTTVTSVARFEWEDPETTYTLNAQYTYQ